MGKKYPITWKTDDFVNPDKKPLFPQMHIHIHTHTHTHIHTPERERDRDRENAFEGRNIILSFVYSGSTNFLTITVSEKEIFPKTN